MKKAAFLDCDGVINRKAPEGEYITRCEDMDIFPEVPGGHQTTYVTGYYGE